MQDLLFAGFGFLFYLSAGSVILDSWRGVFNDLLPDQGKALGLGSLMILQSFIMLGETALSALNVINNKHS